MIICTGGKMRIKLFLLLIALTPCFAQNETADVLGTVKDSRSSAIPKATVTLINQETGIEAKTTADENGELPVLPRQSRQVHGHRRGCRIFEGRRLGYHVDVECAPARRS